MSLGKTAWETLRAVIGITDKVEALSDELRLLRDDHRTLQHQMQDTRERVIRLETIILEAARNAPPRQLTKD